MNRPKLHHHVPQFYQEGFCRDGRLWVFDRVTGKYRPDSPRNVAAKTHDYSLTLADGTREPKVEEFLAQIESEANPILAKLRAGETILKAEKEIFACYLGYFFLRGPRFQRMVDELATVITKAVTTFEISSADDLQREIDSIPNLSEEQRSMMNAQAMFAFLKSEQYRVHVDREYAVKLMLEKAVEIQNYFRQMDWLIMRGPKDVAFLTTDNPLVIVPPIGGAYGVSWMRGAGVITPGAKKVFPLSSESCLVMLDCGPRIMVERATADFVRQTNFEVVVRCERLAIGRDEAHIRSVVRKTQIDKFGPSEIFGHSPVRTVTS